MHHMESNNLFSDHQHGFRPGQSCITQPGSLTNGRDLDLWTISNCMGRSTQLNVQKLCKMMFTRQLIGSKIGKLILALNKKGKRMHLGPK